MGFFPLQINENNQLFSNNAVFFEYLNETENFDFYYLLYELYSREIKKIHEKIKRRIHTHLRILHKRARCRCNSQDLENQISTLNSWLVDPSNAHGRKRSHIFGGPTSTQVGEGTSRIISAREKTKNERIS